MARSIRSQKSAYLSCEERPFRSEFLLRKSGHNSPFWYPRSANVKRTITHKSIRCKESIVVTKFCYCYCFLFLLSLLEDVEFCCQSWKYFQYCWQTEVLKSELLEKENWDYSMLEAFTLLRRGEHFCCLMLLFFFSHVITALNIMHPINCYTAIRRRVKLQLSWTDGYVWDAI